jgi:deoxyribodipyrimidine photolyase
MLKVIVSAAAKTNRDLSIHDNVALKWAIEADDEKVLQLLLGNNTVYRINKRSIQLARTIGQ